MLFEEKNVEKVAETETSDKRKISDKIKNEWVPSKDDGEFFVEPGKYWQHWFSDQATEQRGNLESNPRSVPHEQHGMLGLHDRTGVSAGPRRSDQFNHYL